MGRTRAGAPFREYEIARCVCGCAASALPQCYSGLCWLRAVALRTPRIIAGCGVRDRGGRAELAPIGATPRLFWTVQPLTAGTSRPQANEARIRTRCAGGGIGEEQAPSGCGTAPHQGDLLISRRCKGQQEVLGKPFVGRSALLASFRPLFERCTPTLDTRTEIGRTSFNNAELVARLCPECVVALIGTFVCAGPPREVVPDLVLARCLPPLPPACR